MKNLKLVMVAIFALPVLALAFKGSSTGMGVPVTQEDVAASYKTKCQACHSPKAEKFFDPSMADAALIEIVLKGKKGEKPPYMPGFEAKGMTAEQAGELVKYMRSLRAPAE